MKIVEIVKPRLDSVTITKNYIYNHYFFINIFGEKGIKYLIYPEEENLEREKIRRCHKQVSLKIKNLDLSDNYLRLIIVSYGYHLPRYLLLLDISNDPWELSYNPGINPFDLEEIVRLLSLVKI